MDKKTLCIINVTFGLVVLYFSLFIGKAALLSSLLYFCLGIAILKDFRQIKKILLIIIFLVILSSVPELVSLGSPDLPGYIRLDRYRPIEVFSAFFLAPFLFNIYFLLFRRIS